MNKPSRSSRQNRLSRKENLRKAYERILIVCEGESTEFEYFEGIRKNYRLQTANVVVCHPRNTAPIQLVEHAKKLFEEGDTRKGFRPRSFDRVYVVFDRDNHPSYLEAIQRLDALNGTLKNDAKEYVPFHAALSVPSFELWLLLHYECVTVLLDQKKIELRLEKYLPDYAKAHLFALKLYEKTSSRFEEAFKRAEALSKNDPKSGKKPFTSVHKLVRVLIELNATSSCDLQKT